jgi:hypothetical protein
MGAAALSRCSTRLGGTRRRRRSDQGENSKPPPKFPFRAWALATRRERCAHTGACEPREERSSICTWPGFDSHNVGWITPQPFSSGVSSALFLHVAPCGHAKPSRRAHARQRAAVRFAVGRLSSNCRSIKPPVSPDRARCRQTRATHGACPLAWGPPAMRAPATCRLPARCSYSSRAHARHGRPRSAPSARSTWSRGPSTASNTSPTRESSTRSVSRQRRSPPTSRSDGRRGHRSRRRSESESSHSA